MPMVGGVFALRMLPPILNNNQLLLNKVANQNVLLTENCEDVKQLEG